MIIPFDYLLVHPTIGRVRVAGTADCRCRKSVFCVSATHISCGHCHQLVHRLTDGDLTTIIATCVDGTLTVHHTGLDVDLHRCGEDTVMDAVTDAIGRLTTTTAAVTS